MRHPKQGPLNEEAFERAAEAFLRAARTGLDGPEAPLPEPPDLPVRGEETVAVVLRRHEGRGLREEPRR